MSVLPSFTAPSGPRSTPSPRPQRAAQTPPAPFAAYPFDLDVAAAHFARLYGPRPCYVELCYLDGPPDAKPAPGYHFQWYRYDGTPSGALRLAQRAAGLARRWGNVYSSTHGYTRPGRNRAHIMPSAILFVDDAQRPYGAGAVETSPARYQLYIELPAPLDWPAMAAARRGAARALGADASGAAPYKVGRIPGISINTKERLQRPYLARTAPAPVELGGALDVAALLDAAPSGAAPVEQAAPAVELASIPGGALYHSPRWQRLIAARPQLAQLLIARRPVALPMSSGALDASQSNQVAVFVQNIRTAYNPPPASEIKAVALYLQPILRPDAAPARYAADIDALLARYPARHPESPTRSSGAHWPALDAAPEAPSARPGRPSARPGRPVGRASKVQARIMAILGAIEPDEWGRRVYHNRMIAERLKIAERTVSGHITALARAGAVERGQQGGRGGLPYIVLCRVASNSAVERGAGAVSRVAINFEVCSTTTPESGAIARNAKEVHTPPLLPGAQDTPGGPVELASAQRSTPPAPPALDGAGNDMQRPGGPAPDAPAPAGAHIGGVCTSLPAPVERPACSTAPDAPLGAAPAQDVPPLDAGQRPPARVTLRAAIADAYDAYSGARMTAARVRAYVLANYPALAPAVERSSYFDAARRAVVRDRAWAAKLGAIAGASSSTLKTQLRLAESMLDRAKAHDEPARRFWGAYAAALGVELARRPAPQNRPRRKPTEVKLTPRQAGAIEQRRLLDEIAPYLSSGPAPRSTLASSTPPGPAAPAVEPSAPGGSSRALGMIARLKARIAAGAGAL